MLIKVISGDITTVLEGEVTRLDLHGIPVEGIHLGWEVDIEVSVGKDMQPVMEMVKPYRDIDKVVVKKGDHKIEFDNISSFRAGINVGMMITVSISFKCST